MNLLKTESLSRFDEAILKEDKGIFSGGSGGMGFFTDFVKQVTENFILEIKDLEIIYVYHVYLSL